MHGFITLSDATSCDKTKILQSKIGLKSIQIVKKISAINIVRKTLKVSSRVAAHELILRFICIFNVLVDYRF